MSELRSLWTGECHTLHKIIVSQFLGFIMTCPGLVIFICSCSIGYFTILLSVTEQNEVSKMRCDVVSGITINQSVILGCRLMISLCLGHIGQVQVKGITVKTGFTLEVTPRKSGIEGSWDLASPYVVCPCLHAQQSCIFGLVGGGDNSLS